MNEGSASVTARRVAAHRLDYDRLQAPYGDPAADDALARDVAAGMAVPGGRMHDYLRARTAFFDRVVVNSVDHGIRQVVVGAAGYDGRALRYAGRGVRWFEVDHPATQADKLARIARLRLDAAHVRFIAADFAADPVAGLLRAAGLDDRRPALFLLEGVAVYLDLPVLERVLAAFREVTTVGAPLAISMFLAGASAADRGRFREAVARMGEPVRSELTPEQAQGLLAGAGWQVTEARGRLRSAGLLLARAADPVARAADPAPDYPERTRLTPRQSRPAVPAPMTERLPLSALLSQALVAFTIEWDNEAEHRSPHYTTDHGRPPGAPAAVPWLTSLVMWANCLRFLPDEGITVAGLRDLARTGTNLDGMRRWGYLTFAPGPGGGKRPGPGTVLLPTARGREAREILRGLDAEIEARWRDRFGGEAGALRSALGGVVAALDPGLPDCLPILGHGLFSRPSARLPAPLAPPAPRASAAPADDLPLWALLSQALLALAIEFETESGRSLAISANLLRVLTGAGVRRRDVPAVAGVSREAVAMAMGAAAGNGLAAEGPDPAGGPWKVARLTAAGARAQRAYHDLVAVIEERWQDRFGADQVSALRAVLERLAAADPPPLSAGLEPYPDGWRAKAGRPGVLPHYPMVLHRGGYPDGS
jgi:methyltransferase (TIGR00027 family)